MGVKSVPYQADQRKKKMEQKTLLAPWCYCECILGEILILRTSQNISQSFSFNIIEGKEYKTTNYLFFQLDKICIRYIDIDTDSNLYNICQYHTVFELVSFPFLKVIFYMGILYVCLLIGVSGWNNI